MIFIRKLELVPLPAKFKKSNISIWEKIFAHIETMRPYTVIWCGLVSLAGACLSWNGIPPFDVSLLTFVVPIMGWIAALYLSDYLDRELDSIEKPHRPIPSSRIKPLEALIIGGIYAIIGSMFSWYLGTRNFILVFIVAILVLSYTSIAKSKGLLGHINRGVVTVVAYLYGVFSSPHLLEALPVYIWFIMPVFLFHDANSNLVGAIRDMQGDRKGGYQTIPVKFGLKNSILISFILTIIWLSILFFLSFNYTFLQIEFYFLMIIDLFILLLLYIYLISSIKKYTRRKALRFHEFFVIERITLASALILGVTTVIYGISVFIFSLIITITSQYFLRTRYEFQGES